MKTMADGLHIDTVQPDVPQVAVGHPPQQRHIRPLPVPPRNEMAPETETGGYARVLLL
jgi:hypothetical protein